MRRGHSSYSPLGQGLPLRISTGRYQRLSRPLLRTYALAIHPGRLAVQAGVALVAELSGRLVVQRAVRTHPVVFAPEPLSLLLGVPVVLELLALQELVAEAAVERLAAAVLPRAARRHLDRLGPLARQPAAKRLADELAAVVAADARRRPPPAHHPRQHPA